MAFLACDLTPYNKMRVQVITIFLAFVIFFLIHTISNMSSHIFENPVNFVTGPFSGPPYPLCHFSDVPFPVSFLIYPEIYTDLAEDKKFIKSSGYLKDFTDLCP